MAQYSRPVNCEPEDRNRMALVLMEIDVGEATDLAKIRNPKAFTERHPMHIGKTIVKIRKELDWSQQDLAKDAAVTAANLCGIERGRRDATMATLEKIAAALGLSLSELLAEHEADQEKDDASL